MDYFECLHGHHTCLIWPLTEALPNLLQANGCSLLKAAQPVRICRGYPACSRYTATSDTDPHRHYLCSATLCTCSIIHCNVPHLVDQLLAGSFHRCCKATNLFCRNASHLPHQSLSWDDGLCCQVKKASSPCALSVIFRGFWAVLHSDKDLLSLITCVCLCQGFLHSLAQ